MKTIADIFKAPPREKVLGTENLPYGWCHGLVTEHFKRHLNADTKVIVNAGVFMGRSVAILAQIAPNALIYALDHFRGSPEHQKMDGVDDLFNISCANLWEYRERVIPVVADSEPGLRAIASECQDPELVFVDMAHDEESVARDLQISLECFSSSIICGDDYNWPGVQSALIKSGLRHIHNTVYWEVVR